MSAAMSDVVLFSRAFLGARLRDRFLGCAGALIGIAGVYGCGALLGIPHAALPLLLAPIGASAVLIFVVPASPLSQPWPAIGGSIISATVGVATAHVMPTLWIAAAIAVSAAIAAMTLLHCLHPPGGAAALLAVIGGPAVQSQGYWFALFPIGSNAVALTVTATLFYKLTTRRYPHRARLPASSGAAPFGRIADADIKVAAEAFGDELDVELEDLVLFVRQAEQVATARHGRGAS